MCLTLCKGKCVWYSSYPQQQYSTTHMESVMPVKGDKGLIISSVAKGGFPGGASGKEPVW